MHAIALTRWLEHLRANVVVAREGVDPEGAHQVRVACRRLAVWLELGRVRVLQHDLRWLRDRAGAVRDVDVTLVRDPPGEVSGWLKRRRRASQRRLVAAIDSPRLGALLLALSLLPPLAEKTARERGARIAKRVIELGAAFERTPEEIEGLHRLRRAVRLWRYALEWREDDTAPYREIQEIFGEVADLAVALRFAARYRAPGVVADWRGRIEAGIEEGRVAAIAAWRVLRGHVELSP